MSEPPEASIFINNEFKGKTPLDVTLTEQIQNMRLEAEGFENYEKAIPSQEEAKNESHLSWKIQLKAEAAKAQHANPHENVKAPKKEETLKRVPVKAPVINAESKVEVLKSAAKTPLATKVKKSESFIQIKSFENEKVAGEIGAYIDSMKQKLGLNVKACKVNIAEKGLWTRILVGPFDSTAAAKAELAKVKEMSGEPAFIGGKLNCLP